MSATSLSYRAIYSALFERLTAYVVLMLSSPTKRVFALCENMYTISSRMVFALFGDNGSPNNQKEALKSPILHSVVRLPSQVESKGLPQTYLCLVRH